MGGHLVHPLINNKEDPLSSNTGGRSLLPLSSNTGGHLVDPLINNPLPNSWVPLPQTYLGLRLSRLRPLKGTPPTTLTNPLS